MHKFEVYSRKYPFMRRQYYWRCRYKQGAIDNIVACGGEGYYNLSDLEASLEHFIQKAPQAPILYMDKASQLAHAS